MQQPFSKTCFNHLIVNCNLFICLQHVYFIGALSNSIQNSNLGWKFFSIKLTFCTQKFNLISNSIITIIFSVKWGLCHFYKYHYTHVCQTDFWILSEAAAASNNKQNNIYLVKCFVLFTKSIRYYLFNSLPLSLFLCRICRTMKIQDTTKYSVLCINSTVYTLWHLTIIVGHSLLFYSKVECKSFESKILECKATMNVSCLRIHKLYKHI